MKHDLQTEMVRTREAVVQITSWCIVVALHQSKGVGSARLQKVADSIERTQQVYNMTARSKGSAAAFEDLIREVGKYCTPEMRVPLNRAARNRREHQLRMAADQACQMAWCMFAKAAHEVLGFGSRRLEDVRQEALNNYRQFTEWDREDHRWAMERLRRCVQDALGVEIRIVEDNPTEEKAEPMADTLAAYAARVIADHHRPAGWAVMNTQQLMNKAQRLANQMRSE